MTTTFCTKHSMDLRSALSNMLGTDAHIAQRAASGYAVDIISFDFAKAFNKSPHHAVIKALADHGISGTALRWFSIFLSGRTQQVRVNASYSSSVDVVSGITQTSIAGPSLYAILRDSLLRKIIFFVIYFDDNIKFVADVTTHTVIEVQPVIDEVINWSEENYSPLFIDRCGIRRCGD